jgi:hypothetical protein
MSIVEIVSLLPTNTGRCAFKKAVSLFNYFIRKSQERDRDR